MYYTVTTTERPGKTTVYSAQVPHPDRAGRFTTRRWYGDPRAAERFVADVGPKPASPTRVRDAIERDERRRNVEAAADGRTPTLSAYAREVIAAKLADRQVAYGATTYAADEAFIRTHLDRDPIGRKTLAGITESDARAWVERHYAARSQNGKTFEVLATTTAEKHIRWVRGLFKRAAEVDHHVTFNPLWWFKPMPRRDVAPVKDYPALTEVEFAAVLDVVGGGKAFAANDRGLFRFMFETGLRIAEALALEWCDITDLGDGNVEVHVHRQYSREVDTFGPVKTPTSNRRVVVGAWVLDGIVGERAPRAPLFMRDRGYNAPLARACRRAGVRAISTHGLRHSHATMMRDRGMPPELLCKRLGHKNIATTLTYYVKPPREAQAGIPHARPGACAAGGRMSERVPAAAPLPGCQHGEAWGCRGAAAGVAHASGRRA
jgi:integrase